MSSSTNQINNFSFKEPHPILGVDVERCRLEKFYTRKEFYDFLTSLNFSNESTLWMPPGTYSLVNELMLSLLTHDSEDLSEMRIGEQKLVFTSLMGEQGYSKKFWQPFSELIFSTDLYTYLIVQTKTNR